MTQDKPPTITKLTPAEQRRRRDDRTTAIRLRFTIQRHLGDRDITTPAAIGEALGMPAAAATKLLTRHQWREGDVALLEAAAARLGLNMENR
jgi:saccharopine dehydrogenase-like NADP-dependent oxidoreductase